jgi:uncharacterized LabA/DUF88 family protein
MSDMFKATTQKIELLSKMFPDRILQLEQFFGNSTAIYIDYANVRPWSSKLGWHVEPVRLKQFFSSFDTVVRVNIYNGLLAGDYESEKLDRVLQQVYGAGYVTKPVKIMRKSIDVSSISSTSTDILKSFIRPSLLLKFTVKDIQDLNWKLMGLNKKGIRYIEDRKCNFDVEIGRDMLLDYANKTADCFVLWSGDSDFAGPIEQLLHDGKKVMLFATARKVAAELSDLVSNGLFIYDIQKIKNFICWNKEMDSKVTV